MINNTKDIEYANAYSELLEIFKYLDKSDYNKISQDTITLIETRANKEHTFYYNPQKKLNEQKISKKTREILAVFFWKYWATDEQKEKIELYDKQFYEKQNQRAKEKYDLDNLFKKKDMIKNIEHTKNNTSLVKIEKQENIVIKIIYAIKNKFFR